VLPDLLLSSPAERAIRTAQKMAGEMGYPAAAITTNQDLYHASPDTLLAVVKRLPANHHSVMLFGHNPGLTEFANMLASCDIDNIPTCGIVCVTFVSDTWKETAFSKGIFQFFDYPKKHK
jgi:phosphohistidine phosphatase